MKKIAQDKLSGKLYFKRFNFDISSVQHQSMSLHLLLLTSVVKDPLRYYKTVSTVSRTAKNREKLNSFVSMPLAYFVSASQPQHIFCFLIYTNYKRVFYFFFYWVSYVSCPCALHVLRLRNDIIYYRLEHKCCSSSFTR